MDNNFFFLEHLLKEDHMSPAPPPGQYSQPRTTNLRRSKPLTFCMCHTHKHVDTTSCCPSIWAMNHSQSFWINYSSKPNTKHFAKCPGRSGGWQVGREINWRRKESALQTTGSTDTSLILNSTVTAHRKRIPSSELVGLSNIDCLRNTRGESRSSLQSSDQGHILCHSVPSAPELLARMWAQHPHTQYQWP